MQTKEVSALLLDRGILKILDFDRTMFNTDCVLRKAQRQLEIWERMLVEKQKQRWSHRQPPPFPSNIPTAFTPMQQDAYLNKVLMGFIGKQSDLSGFLMPGMTEYIRIMRITGQTCGIFSKAPNAFIEYFLSHSFVDGISIDDVFPKTSVLGRTILMKRGIQEKPYPEGILLLAKDRRCSRILHLGDSSTDVYVCIISQEMFAKHDTDIFVQGVLVNTNIQVWQDMLNTYGTLPFIAYARLLTEILPS